MQKFLVQYPEYPMAWYALSFSYFFGLIANDFFFHATFLFALLYFAVKLQNIVFYLVSLACFLFGLYYGQANEIPQQPTWLNIQNNEDYSAHIENINSLPDKRLRLVLSNVKDSNSNILPEKTVLYLYYDRVENLQLEKLPIKDMEISFNAKIRPVHFSKNYGIQEAELYWYNQNIFYSGYINLNNTNFSTKGEGSYLAQLRNKLYVKYAKMCMDEAGIVSQSKALLISILFGEKFFLDTKTINIFSETSLIHSLALSGMHLGFVGLCAFVLTKILVSIKPKILYYIPFTIILGFFSLPLAAAYLWLGNMPISLIRASCMLIILWLALVMYKRISLLDNLIMTATLILLLMPRAWTSISFQLSFFAVLSIALSSPLFIYVKNYFASKNEEKYFSWQMKTFLFLFALLWTSFTIQIFLYPLQAYTFGLVSPYFALNILWIPLIDFLVLPSAFLALFTIAIPNISNIFIELASSISELFISFLLFIENNFGIHSIQAYRLDLWQSIAFYLLILAILYYRLFKNKAKLMIVFSFLLLLHPEIYSIYDNYIAQKEDRVEISLLDVGQGQSVLIKWYGVNVEQRALIDAGGVFGNRFDTGRDIVAKVLTYKNLPHIDYVIASHFDADHAKGLVHIMQHFDIDNFLYSKYSKDEPLRQNLLEQANVRNIKQKALKTGDIIELEANKLWLEVLFPPAKGNFSSNNSSLILRLVYKEKGLALISGDSEEYAISRLISTTKQQEKSIESTLLILPHHGSVNSYNEELYAMVSPNIVAASAGFHNRYGFPAKEIIDYFAKQEIQVESTSHGGAVVYIFKNGEFIQKH